MLNIKKSFNRFLFFLMSVVLSSCSTYTGSTYESPNNLRTSYGSKMSSAPANYSSRLPSHLSTGEKTILVDPNVHAWGAYNSDGTLVRAGLVTAGANYCPDIGRACRTVSGSFRIQSLGGAGCKSTIYPRPRGGAPMPYCMFFHKNMALHGSYGVAEANLSHGCVRLHVDDAEWLRFNFANIGTKVVIRPY